MKYALHPEAALEHEDQVAYYEARSAGLGRRYHAAFLSTLLRICDAPYRSASQAAELLDAAPQSGKKASTIGIRDAVG